MKHQTRRKEPGLGGIQAGLVGFFLVFTFGLVGLAAATGWFVGFGGLAAAGFAVGLAAGALMAGLAFGFPTALAVSGVIAGAAGPSRLSVFPLVIPAIGLGSTFSTAAAVTGFRIVPPGFLANFGLVIGARFGTMAAATGTAAAAAFFTDALAIAGTTSEAEVPVMRPAATWFRNCTFCIGITGTSTAGFSDRAALTMRLARFGLLVLAGAVEAMVSVSSLVPISGKTALFVGFRTTSVGAETVLTLFVGALLTSALFSPRLPLLF